MDRDLERGTGRTTRALLEVGPDDIFVVASHHGAAWVLPLARKHGKHLRRRQIVSLDDVVQGKLRGLRCNIIVDHYAEHVCRKHSAEQIAKWMAEHGWKPEDERPKPPITDWEILQETILWSKR